LAGQPLDVVRTAVAQPVLGPGQEAGVEQPWDVGRGDRAVGHPAVDGGDLDQRLEPEQAARAVADDADVQPARGRLPGHGGRHLVRADRAGRRVAGDEDRGHDAGTPASARAVATRPSKRSASTRPYSRSPTMTDGPSAQLPRQKTWSRV